MLFVQSYMGVQKSSSSLVSSPLPSWSQPGSPAFAAFPATSSSSSKSMVHSSGFGKEQNRMSSALRPSSSAIRMKGTLLRVFSFPRTTSRCTWSRRLYKFQHRFSRRLRNAYHELPLPYSDVIRFDTVDVSGRRRSRELSTLAAPEWGCGRRRNLSPCSPQTMKGP